MKRLIHSVWGFAVFALILVLASCGGSTSSSSASVSYTLPVAESSPTADQTAPTPPSGVTAIVDDYANELTNKNPTVAVLSGFNKLWTPGTAWNNGTVLNSTVLAYNNQYVVNVTRNRTLEQEVDAYMNDRRNQSYSAVEGLGPLTSLYLTGAVATTTIPAYDSSTLTTEYDDNGSGNAGGSLTSSLGSVVALVNNLRSFSTTPDKNAYNYPRPWRLNTSGVVADAGTSTTENITVNTGSSTSTASRTYENYNSSTVVAPSLMAVRSATPASDQAFPSGHTNAVYLADLALAYAIPERYQELLTRASELGDSRILAGMHSPLDVMGGRMAATAWAAAILYNDAALSTAGVSKSDAYKQAHTYLFAQTGTDANSLYDYAHSESTTLDPYADWATNKVNYESRLTYGFDQIATTTTAVLVPKGAEVLLETRQPYLTANQRRWVLYTTGIASGYPVLDDAEGWGRLDLFAAADGYGAFTGNVIVVMDATQGGYNAVDSWRNNISGTGKLFKKGTGTLKLTGNNTYSGGTQIDKGTLEADSVNALGRGNVILNGGTLIDKASSTLLIPSSLNILSGSTLELDLSSNGGGTLQVSGIAGLNGTLNVVIGSTFVPVTGTTYDILVAGSAKNSFSTVKVTGTTATYKVVQDSTGVHLTF